MQNKDNAQTQVDIKLLIENFAILSKKQRKAYIAKSINKLLCLKTQNKFQSSIYKDDFEVKMLGSQSLAKSTPSTLQMYKTELKSLHIWIIQ